MSYESDVIVIGCGIAGMSAAATAVQNGVHVRVLERSTAEERGGNSRYTGGNLRIKSLTEPADDLAELLSATSDTFVHRSLIEMTTRPYEEWPPILRAYGFADPELVDSLVSNSPEAVTWLTSCGVRVLEAKNPASGVTEFETVGGGLAAVEGLARVAEEAGVPFHYETAGRSLIMSEDGSVIGVRAWNPTEGFIDFAASAVILACGGFEGNSEMGARYLGDDAYRLRTTSRGGMYNKGEGIEMALAIGAAPAGEYGGFHAMICDPRSVNTESVKPWNYGILVNKHGRRFVDEGSDARANISDSVGRAILAQPDGLAYFIYDNKVEDVDNFDIQIGTEVPPISGSTPTDLAKKLHIDHPSLDATISTFNAATTPGPFRAVIPDGNATIGISPPKSNWARPLEGPLKAYPTVCTNVFTFGGLRIGPTTSVINTEGYPIPGLFAAGETVGLYYGAYATGSSYLRGLVLGRLAGRNSVLLSR